jgi:hypothetical protein
VTDAMREQSTHNEFASETLGLQRQAHFMQTQLALHTLHDRAELRRDYNEGLAEGAKGMAELADLPEGGAWAAEGDAFRAMAVGGGKTAHRTSDGALGTAGRHCG